MPAMTARRGWTVSPILAPAIGRARGAFVAVFALLIYLFASSGASAKDVPPLTGRVTDQAGVLSAEERTQLGALLAAHEQATGHQFAVLIVPSLEGDPIEDFSIRVVEAWQLGKKGTDDGLLLLVALEDRKMRIEVGYGLEGEIPDALAGRIVREEIRPRFKAGHYADGIAAGLVTLMRVSGWEPPATAGVPQTHTPRSRGPVSLVQVMFWIAMIIFFVFMGGRGGGGWLMLFALHALGGGRHFGGGGGGGGGFGGFSGGGGFGGGGASGDW